MRPVLVENSTEALKYSLQKRILKGNEIKQKLSFLKRDVERLEKSLSIIEKEKAELVDQIKEIKFIENICKQT